MEQLTKKQAIGMAKSGIWKEWTDEEIVRFQLFQKKLCMDFDRFHKAMEVVLERPVYTHEFAWMDELKKEYLGGKKPPSLEEIINLIPEEKRIIINTNKSDDDFSV
jgi:hypothetical protein